MPEAAPRCPYCANILKLQPSFWARLGLKQDHTNCPNCQRECEARDARSMGASYFHWAEQFRYRLTEALKTLPILAEPDLHRALGNPSKDDLRLITSVDELVRHCLHHQRTALMEMSLCREATLEVVHLRNDITKASETVAILGTSCSESGAREWQQIAARTGMSHFVLYTYPAAKGAEPRVKRAVHAQANPPRRTTPTTASRPSIGTVLSTRPAAAAPAHAQHR